MDLEVVKRCLNISPRRKKWIVWLALVGASSYGAYTVYNMPSVVRKRKRMMKLLGALISIAEMFAESAETVNVISKDVKQFLQSDSNEIPHSLKQISKIAKSDEFCVALSKVSEALMVGVLRAYQAESSNEDRLKEGSTNQNFTDRVMDRLFSTAGTGFVSVVVGSFARNFVMGFYNNGSAVHGEGANTGAIVSPTGLSSSNESMWVKVVSNDKCKELLGDCIEKFVSTAVAVYLDKTMNINAFDDIFSGMTNPNHQDKVRDILVTVCNGAVETLVRTSHQVLTSTDSSSPSCGPGGHQRHQPDMTADKFFDREVISKLHAERNSSDGIQSSEWLSKASSTLAVPRNRKFVLDVTGRVTFETIRSFVVFLLWKLLDSIRHGAKRVHDEVRDRGLQVIRFISTKSSIITTLCLALYLHVHSGNGVLMSV